MFITRINCVFTFVTFDSKSRRKKKPHCVYIILRVVLLGGYLLVFVCVCVCALSRPPSNFIRYNYEMFFFLFYLFMICSSVCVSVERYILLRLKREITIFFLYFFFVGRIKKLKLCVLFSVHSFVGRFIHNLFCSFVLINKYSHFIFFCWLFRCCCCFFLSL